MNTISSSARWLLLFALAVLPTLTHAQWTYVTSNGTLIITGYTPPAGYNGSITIPSTLHRLPVTGIANQAFTGSSLKTITIPNSVTSIGDSAFASCAGLTSITIPNSVTNIGESAFASCTSLSSITIPKSVVNIGTDAFYECNKLTGITVDPMNPSYSSANGVLFNKNQTTLIRYPSTKAGIYTVPSSVTLICEKAFYNCGNLTRVSLPNSVTEIGNSAFASCKNLVSITIPKNVTSIGIQAFSNCTSMTSITVDPMNSFYNSLDGVLCDKKTDALLHCPLGKAGSYTIPNTITGVGDNAFLDCVKLTSLTIPTNVIAISRTAFNHCYNLAAITVAPGNPVYSSVDGILFYKNQTMLLRVPSGKKLTSYTVPNTVTSIGSWAFADSKILTSVTIPDKMTDIEDFAFWGCNNLTKIFFEGNAFNIGESVFDGNSKAKIYYLATATGWGATFGGRPTEIWEQQETKLPTLPQPQR